MANAATTPGMFDTIMFDRPIIRAKTAPGRMLVGEGVAMEQRLLRAGWASLIT